MIIGFTGTREGMTALQARALVQVILDLGGDYREAHHGDCVGADWEFDKICRELDFDRIVIHPPKDNKLRAYCQSDFVLPAKDYAERNQDIVKSSYYVIGAPKDHVMGKGGTWQTVRMAQKLGNLHCVVYPNGTVVSA